ncbi:MAG: DUF434 domain-containing protein [Candidatus Methanolliviera hydrocarbonicum]|jgi:Uncharacterized conserved protein|uniref:DUF434 domain-containing protein n=1 Tax=Candidatus Methanolliviera hydrocarbonicum TaxID=2491085 RepID=A0A520KYT3_9EURY|nr:MAG: DUF434 domain-containing protein [Candidatus Methanolliviera hydrocarbonicum]
MKFEERMKALEVPLLDVRFLLDRRYPKDYTINFVSNHYRLIKEDRNVLFRIACEKKLSEERMKKLVSIDFIKGKSVVMDGYNVLITVESLILGYPVFLCDDGVLKDIRAIFHRYRIKKETKESLEKIKTLLSKYLPKEVIFIFDAQISESGKLSALTREIFEEMNTSVLTSKDADYQVKRHKDNVVATSDGNIMDNVRNIVDIPSHVGEEFGYPYYKPTTMRFCLSG